LHKDRTKFALERLLEAKLIFKSIRGYKLLSLGLDVYALKILVEDNIISGIGNRIGIGKESDIIEAISQRNQLMVIKFFRIGRISFTDAKRKRAFEKKNMHTWFLLNIEAAKKEYDILVKLKQSKMNIVTPHYRSMHTIVMDRIQGKRLSDNLNLEDPLRILQKILSQVKLAYDQKIINSDLNENNIIIDNEDRIWIIAWPQAVSTKHPNSKYLLERDLKNICRYFEKKYGVRYDPDKVNNKISLDPNAYNIIN
jgi:RIO kinase 2